MLNGGALAPPFAFGGTPNSTCRACSEPKGGVFGFGGGYNWQYGAWVGGVEVDYGFSHEKETQTIPITDQEDVTSVSLHSKIDALGSARLRVGYLFTPNVLAYGTAGLGWDAPNCPSRSAREPDALPTRTPGQICSAGWQAAALSGRRHGSNTCASAVSTCITTSV